MDNEKLIDLVQSFNCSKTSLPPVFNDAQQKSLLDAGKQAKYKIEALIR
jgi:hypothetical protein